MQVSDEPFEVQQTPVTSTLSGSTQLLSFAADIGSGKGLMRALISPLASTGSAATVQLGIAHYRFSTNSSYIIRKVNDSAQTWAFYCHSTADGTTAVTTELSDCHKASVTAQVCRQLESALHTAYRLQLPSVVQILHGFLHNNTCWCNSLLYGSLPMVLTARALDAAKHGNLLSPERLLVANAVAARGTFVERRGCEQLLKPLNLTPEQSRPITFTAEVLRDCLGCRKGQQVQVELDLFGESVARVVGQAGMTAQLQFGPAKVEEVLACNTPIPPVVRSPAPAPAGQSASPAAAAGQGAAPAAGQVGAAAAAGQAGPSSANRRVHFAHAPATG